MGGLVVILLGVGGLAWLVLTEPRRSERRHQQRLKDIRLHLNVMFVLDNPGSELARALAEAPEIKRELDRLAR